jgi:hypothetical protein
MKLSLDKEHYVYFSENVNPHEIPINCHFGVCNGCFNEFLL